MLTLPLAGDVQRGKEAKINSLQLQLFYYMSEFERVSHLNAVFDEWPDQLQALQARSLDLANCSFSWWTSLFQAFVSSPSIVDLSEACRVLSLGQSDPPATCVLKLACFHPLSKCVWSFVQQGEARGLLKERKTPSLLANVCELTEL